MKALTKRNICSLAVRSTLFSSAALAGLQAVPAVAQNEQLADPIATSERLALEEVIVTARRRSESLQDVPLTINALNRETLNQAGINGLEGIAAFTPGFDFAQSFGRQDFRPAIRGQSTIQGGASAGLYVDGFYISEGGATMPLTAIERVEVVKGPQSALYGRSTLAGAVNYILKRPTEKFEGETRLTAGEDGELRGDLTLRGPATDTIGYMVSVSGYKYDGQYENNFAGNALGAPANHDDVGGQETGALAAMFTWEPNERFDSSLQMMYEKTDDDPYAIGLLDSSKNNCKFGPPPNPPAGTPGDGHTGSAYNNSGYYCGTVDTDNILDQNNGKTNLENGFFEDMGTQFEAMRLGLTLGWDFDQHHLQSKTGYNDYSETARQDQGFGGSDYYVVNITYPPFSDPLRFGFLTETSADTDDFSQEFTFASTNDGPLNYLVGAYYYTFKQTSKQRDSSAVPYAAVAPGKDEFPMIGQANNEVENWAVYGQLIYNITDDLTAGVEVRYNEDEVKAHGGSSDLDLSETYDSILPRYTLDWALNEDVMVYGVVSKGNKPGDWNTQNDIRDDQRPVDEEQAWNYELGVKSTFWDGRATINAAAYYIDWEDQQLTTTTVGASGSGSYSILDNLGKTEITGFEFELTADATDWWTVYLGYSYTDSDIKSYRISAEENLLSPNSSSGMSSAYEEAAQQGFPYTANGDVMISGTQLPQVSENQVTFSNTIHGHLVQDWNWFARADYIFNSERYAQVYNSADTGDINRVNLRVGASNERFDVEVWLRNATDDDASPALIRYVQTTNEGVFNYGPDRAIGATLPEQRAAGITVGMRF